MRYGSALDHIQRQYLCCIEALCNSACTSTLIDRGICSGRLCVNLLLNAAFNICFAGRELYRKFQVDADTGFSQSHVAAENANYTLDQIVAMNSIKRTVEHLEHKLDKITDMWQDKERGVGEKLQLSDLETAMKTVISL